MQSGTLGDVMASLPRTRPPLQKPDRLAGNDAANIQITSQDRDGVRREPGEGKAALEILVEWFLI
jgi:hypothetical protein